MSVPEEVVELVEEHNGKRRDPSMEEALENVPDEIYDGDDPELLQYISRRLEAEDTISRRYGDLESAIKQLAWKKRNMDSAPSGPPGPQSNSSYL